MKKRQNNEVEGKTVKRKAWSLRESILWPVIMTVVVIVALISLIVSRMFTQQLLEQENTRTQTSFGIVARSMSSVLESLQTTASMMLMDDSIENYAIGYAASKVDRVLKRREVVQTIDRVLDQNPALYGVIFLREDGTAFGKVVRRTFFMDDNPDEILTPEVRRQIYATTGRSWAGPVTGPDLYKLKVTKTIPDKVVVGIAKTRSMSYGTVYALAIVDTAKLGEYIESIPVSQGSLYLVNAEGEELYRTENAQPIAPDIFNAVKAAETAETAETAKATEAVEAVEPGSHGGSAESGSHSEIADLGSHGEAVVSGSHGVGSETIHKSDGEQVYISYQYIDSMNWYLIRELPVREYDRAAASVRRSVWNVALAVLAAAVALSLWWLRGFLRTFEALRAGIESLGKGNLGTQIETPFAITEFENIRNEFNAMNTALQEQMAKTSAMERVQLEMEIRTLQTQLSPHMIFNSITAIRWMAVMVGADRVSDMLCELSEMLRPVFRDWKIEWTLREELEHLRHYTHLLDLRYENNFQMTTEIDESMLDVQIPRFTIQPIIENSCEHGGYSSSRLCVLVRTWQENGRMFLSVADNGSGIEPQVLERIREHLNQDTEGYLRLSEDTRSGLHGSVGLLSVCNRMRLCKGKDSNIVITCPAEGGTVVTLSWSQSQG